MEMKQISDKTIKITITMEDMDQHGMEIADFLVPQDKTEEFFYNVMDEMELPESFQNGGVLSFRVTPRKDKVDVFVTRSEISEDFNLENLANMGDVSQMSPEEFFKNLEASIQQKGDTQALEHLAQAEKEETATDEDEDKKPEFVHYVLDFTSRKDLLRFAKEFDLPAEASELYKYGRTYHLTLLFSLINQPSYFANLINARLLEHAKAGSRSRAYLLEHGVLLLPEKAIETLKELG